MDKVPLVLFSGGLDSSYSLYQALKEGNAHTLYIDGTQGPEKIFAELTARKNIKELLSKKVDKEISRDYTVGPQTFYGDITGYRHTGVADAMFSQAHRWLFGALEVSDGNLHNWITISYVNGDQISSKIPDIINAWTSLQSFVKATPIGIYTPLLWTKKIDIVNNLLLDFPELLGSIWICEDPIRKMGTIRPHCKSIRDFQSHLTTEMEHTHCGHCTGCVTMTKTLMEWELTHRRSFSKALEAVISKPAFTDAYKLLDMAKDELVQVEYDVPGKYSEQLDLGLERTEYGTIDSADSVPKTLEEENG